MGEFLRRLFDSDFMPHGACWRWQPWLLWSHALSDGIIAVCLVITALTLIHVVLRRRDVPFEGVVVMFGVFTLACACTHAMEAYNVWHGLFRLAGLVKLITALASLVLVALFLPIVPKLMVVPSLNRALEDQVKAQLQDLWESEARLQGFIRHASAAIAFKGADGRFLLINPRMEALLGRPVQEILGRTNQELFPAEDCARVRESDRRVLELGEESSQEEQWTRADGTHHHYLVHKFPLLDSNGRCWGLGLIATDITERRQQEQALLQSQKLESLGVLVGGIAHDFNNLLGAMQGNVELALMEGSLVQARPHLETLRGLMAKASDLIRHMLAYAGQGKSSARLLDLNQLVQEMSELLRTSISKKASIHLDLHPGALAMEADPSQVEQVLMNLVINASEAFDEKSGVIVIRTRREQLDPETIERCFEGQNLRPGAYVALEVADSGAGMSPEVLKRIFDPFFTTKFTGRGLGLAAIHGILRGHQGGLRVSSETGQGSTFKLLFPAAEGTGAPPPRAEAPPPEAALRRSRSGTVLVVDDEEQMRAVVVKALERVGFHTLQAGDGREALRLYLDNPARIRLILMDLTMPRMDGEEACRELRRSGCAVPVILSSGFNEADALRKFQDLQLAGFIQKPFSLVALVELIRRVLGG